MLNCFIAGSVNLAKIIGDLWFLAFHEVFLDFGDENTVVFWVAPSRVLEPFLRFDQIFPLRLPAIVDFHLIAEALALACVSLRDVAAE